MDEYCKNVCDFLNTKIDDQGYEFLIDAKIRIVRRFLENYNKNQDVFVSLKMLCDGELYDMIIKKCAKTINTGTDLNSLNKYRSSYVSIKKLLIKFGYESSTKLFIIFITSMSDQILTLLILNTFMRMHNPNLITYNDLVVSTNKLEYFPELFDNLYSTGFMYPHNNMNSDVYNINTNSCQGILTCSQSESRIFKSNDGESFIDINGANTETNTSFGESSNLPSNVISSSSSSSGETSNSNLSSNAISSSSSISRSLFKTPNVLKRHLELEKIRKYRKIQNKNKEKYN